MQTVTHAVTSETAWSIGLVTLDIEKEKSIILFHFNYIQIFDFTKLDQIVRNAQHFDDTPHLLS